MKQSSLVKQEWLELAISIHNHHLSRIKANGTKWRIKDTAREINRSVGYVSQYITIASWLRTHEYQLRRLDSMKEAIEFIGKLKKSILLRELEL